MKCKNANIYNEKTWDEIAKAGDRFYQSVSASEVEAARIGNIRIKLTPTKWLPPDWIGFVDGKAVLCLACGGGQQAPLLAAAGARTTVFDISREQLQRDQQAAKQFDLEMEIVSGDMANLSVFKNDRFDLIINPCSVCFCPNLLPIWNEVFRVMKPGADLLVGFIKPINYLFDVFKSEQGELIVRNKIPYSDLDLPADQQQRLLGSQRPIEFGHTLNDLIGMQIAAGLQITGYYEDRWGDDDLLSDHIDVFGATKATKPKSVTTDVNF